MNRKLIFPSFLGLMLMLVSCMQSPHAVVSSTGATPTPTASSSLTPFPAWWSNAFGGLNGLSITLSPDGKWLARNINDLHAVEFVSTSNPSQTLLTPAGAKLGEYVPPAAWAPDSSAFIAYGADNGCEKCPFDRVIIYGVQGKGSIADYYVFEPHYSSVENAFATSWSPLSWSPDASQFAISLNLREILILDKHARVIQRVMPSLTNSERVVDLWWAQNGLLYVIDNGAGGSKLQRLDLADPIKSDTLLSQDGSMRIIGLRQDPTRLLISYHQWKDNVSDLQLMNAETGKLERTIPLKGTLCRSSDSPNSPSTAIETCDGKTNLWLFDWNRSELVDQGEVQTLIGWHTDIQGFVIVKGTAPESLWIEVVKP